LIAGIVILLFHYYYFYTHSIENANVDLYQTTLILPFILLFLSFMLFLSGLIGNQGGEEDDDDDLFDD